ncbi:IS66 family transposase [Nostoc flagelliforme FACHB-838]|uniref:IS66 family transposase n=1 Tax=Nostoc flagelliforme FACHB-838 TaxID=2692904 RepID=A0ABR8DWU6_9NOSO|nr:IS66 family transposase [Nostoc flagelliforme]MBD2533390.1 IS66 family transposase [Nostoc flagelliforme FACHB-838]
MNVVITSEILKAYSLCPRKAYLLMYGQEQGKLHEYEKILSKHQLVNQNKKLESLKQKYINAYTYNQEKFKHEYEFLIDVKLVFDRLQANCPVLTKVDKHNYEAIIFIGTHTINKIDKLELFFIGYVLSKTQGQLPDTGSIINVAGKVNRLKLEKSHKVIAPLLNPLQQWLEFYPNEPSIVLNKHCPICQFSEQCHAKAIQEDNLSRLNHVTLKTIHQYAKKGIFTVNQLSYLFKPRKRKRRTRKPHLVLYKPELQALAIRTNTIYLQEKPELSRCSIEIFLDIESIPDQEIYYLIGLIISQDSKIKKYSFWANNAFEEEKIFKLFLAFINQYQNAPIYHYGSFEPQALKKLTKRYSIENKEFFNRLININSYIYGKIYFPVYSNKLKELGKYLGAKWTSSDASGLQSLVWKHIWDEENNNKYKDKLLQYNIEDCIALKLVTDKITEIGKAANTLEGVDFADERKQQLSISGQEAITQLKDILKFAHFNYDRKKISFQPKKQVNRLKQGKARSGKVKPKPFKIVYVEPEQVCEQCGYDQLKPKKEVSKRLITDLKLTISGIRKTITEYMGNKVYCPKCLKSYSPPSLRKYKGNQYYGFGLRAWAIYHRVALRLPYEGITELLNEQFHENVWHGRIPDFIKQFAQYYKETEQNILIELLRSPFIHADETKLNIGGINWYCWVFTNEKYVIFKLRETRESDFLHEFLKDYRGILITDFYSGYDSLDCEHQKCWAHLIRDLNEDLNNSPFDIELEMFVLQIKNLLVPIMEAIKKYGLKKRHLKKFITKVDSFYQLNITDKTYNSELVITYQKRILKYRNSLFTFLQHDNIPWHNNTAERAIRPLALQRDRSSPLGETVTPDYLTLLSIQQTCRFQSISFFKFLFSEETDINQFKLRKRKP